MVDTKKVSDSKTSADWLLRGVLTKVGDTFDRFTGRRWIPSSSLAASELVERLKKLLDAEAQTVAGKGLVVPHNITLKMQWDKFSTDTAGTLETLETELLTAAVDHINDRNYYTFAPLMLAVKQDYFTEGVKLYVSFDKFDSDEREAELNITVPSMNIGSVKEIIVPAASVGVERYIARFELRGVPAEKTISGEVNGRISVGRTKESDLVIDDPSVSKIHASLLIGFGGKLAVADTGSTNGTYLNEERIGYGRSVAIGDADRLKFGTVEVTIVHVEKPEPEVHEETEQEDSKTVEIGGFEFSGRKIEPRDPDSNPRSTSTINVEDQPENETGESS